MRERDADADLMLRYAAGDERAFERLYERHRRGLWRYVLRLLRNPAVADDVFQECWSRVIASRTRYRPEARFATWLWRIAHNCCMDYFRSDRRRTGRETSDEDALTVASDDPAAGPEEMAAGEQAGERLTQALGELPEAQRAVFLLYVEGGLSVSEIGELTGVGAETAKSRLRYAVARLQEALGAAAPE
ncbi:MAG: RNA polymerase sigma factor [Gammaproteobacteria bacterium]|nr:RNA polymerase sigma factor [Gammaproteobacteria bacterium]